RGGICRRPRCADQPAADGRLRLRRLRTVHPPGAGGRGRPGRPLDRAGQDRVRDPPVTTTVTTTQPAPVPADRERKMTTGATVWLTGLPSAGKTTIANAL